MEWNLRILVKVFIRNKNLPKISKGRCRTIMRNNEHDWKNSQITWYRSSFILRSRTNKSKENLEIIFPNDKDSKNEYGAFKRQLIIFSKADLTVEAFAFIKYIFE